MCRRDPFLGAFGGTVRSLMRPKGSQLCDSRFTSIPSPGRASRALGKWSIMPHALSECDQTVSRPLRVLMIEDSPADASLVEWELKHAGYQASVRRVDTEAELRVALDEGSWDIVTCD